MDLLKSLLLRSVGIIFGPILGMMFGIIIGFTHLFSGECIPWCPGLWLHPLAVAVGFVMAILILSEVFEGQDLYKVIEKQNSAYFS